MELTKREILISIGIIVIMLGIGFFISNKIDEYILDKNEQYYKALHIESEELFRYGMDTNVGNAFVYGDLEAIDTVSFSEINGQYLSLIKVKEVYTKHTRVVTYTSNGKTKTRTETYWTWDTVDREKKQAKEVKLLNQLFLTSQFNIPTDDYITTINTSPTVRYKYYGYPAKSTVTIFSNLQDKNIDQSDISIYTDLTIEETIELLEHNKFLSVGFWIIWIILIAFVVYKFCYL